MDAIVFRKARGNEAALLGEVSLRSKGYWGYSEDFLDACRAELTFHPEDLAARRVVVADSPAGVVGFYSIDGQPPSGELGNLWVVPERIGTGLGRKLYSALFANIFGWVPVTLGALSYGFWYWYASNQEIGDQFFSRGGRPTTYSSARHGTRCPPNKRA
jgi:hypothetical protein